MWQQAASKGGAHQHIPIPTLLDAAAADFSPLMRYAAKYFLCHQPLAKNHTRFSQSREV